MRKHASDKNHIVHGIDIRPFEGVDYVLNVGKEKLPFKTSSIDQIRSIHLYEHLHPDELFFSIDECWRVLKPTGKLHIEVPKAMTDAYFIHPDHKIQFIENTFSFFQVPSDGKDAHGYIKHFWHVGILPDAPEQAVHVDLYPNKPNGTFDYKEVK